MQASCWLHEYAVPSKRNAMLDKPIKLYTQMKLRTQMQPHTILLRPSETLHDGTKNGRTTKSHKINISSCSPKKRNKMCLLQRRRRKCNNSKLVSSAKKSHNCEVVRDKPHFLKNPPPIRFGQNLAKPKKR